MVGVHRAPRPGQEGGPAVADRLILHIGTQKSGTTYLQRILQNLSPRLRKSGVLYPIRLVGKRQVLNHEAAAYGLLGTAAFPWVPPHRAQAQTEAWTALVDKVRRWDGTAIVSGEALSVIDADAAARLVESLGVPKTQIVITARDLGRVLPSSWQQHIRNGRSTAFTTYLRQLERLRGDGGVSERRAEWERDPEQTFWRAYAIGSLADRWSRLAESVHVVGVPRRGGDPDELWHRFIRGIGIDDVAPQSPPMVDSVSANIGITEPETLVLASLNRALDTTDLVESRRRAIRGRIVREAFVPRPDRGRRVVLPEEWGPRVSAWAEEDLEELQATGAYLHTDPTDLLVDPEAVSTGAPSPDQIADAAGVALALLGAAIPEEQPEQKQGRRRP